jgi:hypothetical protein
LKFWERWGDLYGVALCKLFTARLEYSLQNPTEAIRHLKHAESIFREFGDAVGQAVAELVLIDIAGDSGQRFERRQAVLQQLEAYAATPDVPYWPGG